MSSNLDRLSREVLELSADEKVQLVEAVLASLARDADSSDLSQEQQQRIGELWDEGIASGPGESLSMAELIAQAKSGVPSN